MLDQYICTYLSYVRFEFFSRLSWSKKPLTMGLDSTSLIATAFRFGRPISLESYKELFLSGVDGAPRAAVKRLTRAIKNELVEATINAPDW